MNTIHIGGIPVEFPYQSYGTQMAFMSRVISTLDRSQREGHCHALLESPTDTGKSLSLLCSALAWQQNQKSKNIRFNLTHSSSRADPQAITNPINYGGRFIPSTQPLDTTMMFHLNASEIEQSIHQPFCAKKESKLSHSKMDFNGCFPDCKLLSLLIGKSFGDVEIRDVAAAKEVFKR